MRKHSFITLFLAWILLGITACNPYSKEIPTGRPLKIDNVYTNPSYDYTQLVNVLLLPIGNPLENTSVQSHKQTLVNEIIRNFSKFHYFNIQYDTKNNIVPGSIVNLSTDSVNKAALGALGEKYHAQGILKIDVVELQVFAPMRIHVKASLLDSNKGDLLWAIDQVFDADDAEVMNGLRMWWNTRMAGGDDYNRFEIKKITPSFFLNYVFYSVADSFGRSRVKNVLAIDLEKTIQENK